MPPSSPLPPPPYHHHNHSRRHHEYHDHRSVQCDRWMEERCWSWWWSNILLNFLAYTRIPLGLLAKQSEYIIGNYFNHILHMYACHMFQTIWETTKLSWSSYSMLVPSDNSALFWLYWYTGKRITGSSLEKHATFTLRVRQF